VNDNNSPKKIVMHSPDIIRYGPYGDSGPSFRSLNVTEERSVVEDLDQREMQPVVTL
jgi:hypothetical protein